MRYHCRETIPRWPFFLIALGLVELAGQVAHARQSVDPNSLRIIGSPIKVASESLFGPLRPDAWRPLSFSTLFTEGWDEVYAPAPGDAPRRTWINNADGAFSRLFVFSFAYARDLPGGGDAYNGAYFLFTPRAVASSSAGSCRS